MLTLLISVGRFSVALAAGVTVAVATATGWFYGVGASYGSGHGPLGAFVGFLGGVLTAGSVFGLAAAVFDMQRSLRFIARNQEASAKFSDS